MEDISAWKFRRRLGLFVPLDHRDVVRPRPPSHEYTEVRKVMDRDMGHIRDFLARLAPYLSHEALDAIPSRRINQTEPYWDNGFFSGDDARLAFAIPPLVKPKTIIEIGSGNSTRFFRKSIETFRLGTRIVSIDPAPRAEVTQIAHEVISTSVLDVPLAEFDRLGPNDILFHDGSHVTFNGSDTVQLFLEILPRLKAGVLVHVHDICLPLEYVGDFDMRGYSEQYLLAAALLFGDRWQVKAPVAYLSSLRILTTGGVSFWMVGT